jgi:hypothetical protein
MTYSPAQMRSHVEFVKGYVPRLNRDAPTFGHCIPGVHNKIDYNLFDLAGICIDVVGSCGKSEHEFDVFANQMAQHFLDAFEYNVDIEEPWSQDLASAK